MFELRTHKHPLRFIGLALVAILLGGLLYAAPALAATVSVSATVDGGPVNVSASATFPPGESGTLSVYRDSTFIGGKSGSGTITWTGTIEGAGLSNGEHTARATAGGAEATNTFIIDNPVSVSVNAPSVPQAPMDVTGSAQFYARLHPGDITGNVYILKLSPGATTGGDTLRAGSYTTPSVSYSCQDMNLITGLIDVGNWNNGQWKIRAKALGANNASIYDDTIITIVNPIAVSVSVPSQPREPANVTANAQFIARAAGVWTGQIRIRRRASSASSWSDTYCIKNYYETGGASLDLETDCGTLLDVATWTNRNWDIGAIATAPNDAVKIDFKTITVDNTPKLTASCPRYVSGNFDITGSAMFTEPLSGNKGTVYIKIDSKTTSGAFTKTFAAGASPGFSYAEMAGAPLNADTLGHGEHVAYIRALSRNSTWSDWLAVPFRTGPPEADGSGNLKIVIP